MKMLLCCLTVLETAVALSESVPACEASSKVAKDGPLALLQHRTRTDTRWHGTHGEDDMLGDQLSLQSFLKTFSNWQTLEACFVWFFALGLMVQGGELSSCLISWAKGKRNVLSLRKQTQHANASKYDEQVHVPRTEYLAASQPPTWYSAFEAVCETKKQQTTSSTPFTKENAALMEFGAPGSQLETILGHAELKKLVDDLAAGLQEHGAKPGSVVGLYLDRGIHFAALMLACSKLGACALPLPPESPAERLNAIIGAAKVCLLCHKGGGELATKTSAATIDVTALQHLGAEKLKEGVTTTATVDPWSGGVVLTSSGSTGVPKLIHRTPASFYHRLDFTEASHPVQDEVCIQKSNMYTTHSIYEMLEPLLSGTPLCILQDVSKLGLKEFWRQVGIIGPRRLLLVPSLIEATLSQPNASELLPSSLRIVVLMGEAPKRPLCNDILAKFPDLKLLSIYGSTEASSSMNLDINTEFQDDTVGDDGLPPPLPLGRPISRKIGAWVLDDDKHPVKTGEAGTLWISGPHLFHQYVGAEELTSASFSRIPDPNVDGNDMLVFCTQDRVRMDTKGNLQYLGRADDVVKIRGNRIQLSEIDHHIVASGLANQCVTLLMPGEHANDEPVIVSCVTPADCPKAKLRESLLKRMPPYMLPGSIMALETMPLTSSSKTDRMALKALYQTKRHELHMITEADADEEEEVEDSLGQTRKGGQDAKTEQDVIRDLYVFGCVGIVVSHWELYLAADYYKSLTFPAMMTLQSIGVNMWHSQIFGVLCGYSDGIAGEESFASFGAKYRLWIVLILVTPWFWCLLYGLSWPDYDHEDFWDGPRIYLAIMFMSRLWMMAMFKLRVPRWLMLVLAFPFAGNLKGFLDWVYNWTRAQGFLTGTVFDFAGISVRTNIQPPRFALSYIVGVLAVPLVRAAGKTAHLSLSGSHKIKLGIALWVFFGLSCFAEALFEYYLRLNDIVPRWFEDSIFVVLPGTNVAVIHTGLCLFVAWLQILLLAGALILFPLTGVPASAKTSFLAAFLLSGKTHFDPRCAPFQLFQMLPKWTSLQLVMLASYFLCFLGVAAALLQVPISMCMQLFTKKSTKQN